MTYSPLTTHAYSTSQKSSRNGVGIFRVVLHHAATTSFEGVIGMMVNETREVSSNYVVKDDLIASVVPEEYSAWSLGDQYQERPSITFEICNESAGGSWPVSGASHESVAQVCRDIERRYGIRLHREGDPRGWTFIGHREVNSIHGGSYPTACPGGLNMDWIAARIAELRTIEETPEEEEEMAFGLLFHIKEGANTGTKADYRAGKDYNGDGEVEHYTYNDQWFVQTEPNGPLYWVEFTGTASALATKLPVIERTGAQLRDMEIARFGHVPIVGGEILYK